MKGPSVCAASVVTRNSPLTTSSTSLRAPSRSWLRPSFVQSAMIVAISQILLVDVYYVLNGTRGIATAGASAALLLVGWGVIGMVDGKLSDGQGAEAAG